MVDWFDEDTLRFGESGGGGLRGWRGCDFNGYLYAQDGWSSGCQRNLTKVSRDRHCYVDLIRKRWPPVWSGAVGYFRLSFEKPGCWRIIWSTRRCFQRWTTMTGGMIGRLLKVVANRMADGNKGEQALTERELFVIRLVSSGASNQEIALKLFISVVPWKAISRTSPRNLSLRIVPRRLLMLCDMVWCHRVMNK